MSTRDTDPMPIQERPVLQINLSRRAAMGLIALLTVPGGVGIWKATTVGETAADAQQEGERAGQVAAQAAQQASVEVAQAWHLYRTEQLSDRAEIQKLARAYNEMTDEFVILRAVVARALPSAGRMIRERPKPAKVELQPKPAIPANPPAATAASPTAPPAPEQSSPM